jgi:hypothetical protein
MAQSLDQFSIVIIGAMNPSIHHPSWYRLVGILAPPEAETAAKAAVCTPFGSQFQVGDLLVKCEPGRWLIQTGNPAALDRMVAIAAATFDHLPETPVGAYGLNFLFVRGTKLADIGKALAKAVNSLALGLWLEAAATVTFSVRIPTEGRMVQQDVAAVGGQPSHVSVSHNMHYTIQEGEGRFDLGGRLRELFPKEHGEAQQRTENIVTALNLYTGD